jgi:hypothetical protein
MKRRPLLLFFLLSALGCLLLTAASCPSREVTVATEPQAPIAVAIPGQADWVDCGPILSQGIPGEWDTYLWGGFAATVVKRDGLFYLYYQGANGYSESEGTVTWRAIGVATSQNGVHFRKYENNPVLSWFPHNHLEEGAVSAGVFLEANGELSLYYGANSWLGGDLVNADGRLAVSEDGFHFQDQGIVLNHSNSSVWGHGDELFPVAGLRDAGQWFLYYIPNGTAQRGLLGIAWGKSLTRLPQSAAALSNGSSIPVWGPASFVHTGEGRGYVTFLNNQEAAGGPLIEARFVSLDAPNVLSAPLASYQFENVRAAIFLRDDETGTWHMYYRAASLTYYGAMVASADGSAITCPGDRAYLPLMTNHVRPSIAATSQPSLRDGKMQ